jgi:Icc protein
MKIVHISDLHLDAVYKQENYKKTLQLLQCIIDTGFDHLVITGDITENAEKSAFKLARRTLKKFNLLNPAKTTIIIGNHDIFGGVHLTEDLLNYPKKCKVANYTGKVEEFSSAFAETYNNVKTLNTNSTYPFVKEFDEFVLLGLNSIAEYSLLKNPFASNGKISQEQINSAQELLKHGNYKNKKVIILTHHHFCKSPLFADTSQSSVWQKIEKQTMKLRNKKTLLKFFKDSNAELVLHGHLHESAEYTRKGIKFLNAGGSILGKNKNILNFNVINISSREIKTSVESTQITNYPAQYYSNKIQSDFIIFRPTRVISLN